MGNRLAECLEFNELFRIMSQVETLLIGHRSDAPLLHGQRAEKNLDRPAIFILADLFDYQGMSRDRMAFNLCVENRSGVRFLHFTAKGSSVCVRQLRGFQNLRDRRNHITITRAGIEECPALLPVNFDCLSDSPHRLNHFGFRQCSGQGQHPTSLSIGGGRTRWRGRFPTQDWFPCGARFVQTTDARGVRCVHDQFGIIDGFTSD